MCQRAEYQPILAANRINNSVSNQMQALHIFIKLDFFVEGVLRKAEVQDADVAQVSTGLQSSGQLLCVQKCIECVSSGWKSINDDFLTV